MSEAEKIQFNNTISTLSSELKGNFTGINPIKQSVVLVEGQEPVEFEHNFAIPAEFKEEIPELMSAYFLDTGKPINQQTLGDFLDYVDKTVWVTYGAKMVENAVASAVMKTHKDLVAKYENLSGGRQKSSTEFGNPSDATAFNGFADSIVS